MWIKYFIPDDGDDQSHPNVFQIAVPANANGVTLGVIKQNFPLPGDYHFRFLKTISGSLTVWFDVCDNNAVVPVQHDGAVFLKVSRLSTAAERRKPASTSGNSSSTNENNNREPFSGSAGGSSSFSSNNNNSSSQGAQPRVASVNRPTTANIAPVLPPKPVESTTEKLIQFDAMDDASPPAPVPRSNSSVNMNSSISGNSSSTGGGGGSTNLLEMDDTPVPIASTTQRVQSAPALDLFGLDTLQPIQPTAPVSMGPMGQRTSMTGGLPFGAMSSPSNSLDPFGSLGDSSKSNGGGGGSAGYERRGSSGGSQQTAYSRGSMPQQQQQPPPQARRPY